jgi:hypothetical protein
MLIDYAHFPRAFLRINRTCPVCAVNQSLNPFSKGISRYGRIWHL